MSRLDSVKQLTARGSPSTGNTIRVVATRTGIAMDTLRVWERRYGFPAPTRRAGSNRRLYDDADVEKLVAMTHAMERGFRVGDIVDKSLEDLLALSVTTIESSGAMPGIVELVALLERDEVISFESELRRLAAALGARRFVTDVAQPLAVAVGAAWEAGRLAVRHEHVATECLSTRHRSMLAAYQDLDVRPRVVLATLPAEPHTLALDMVALYLAVAGAKPRLIGASTPVAEIVAGVTAFKGDVVGVTVGPTADRTTTRRALQTLVRSLPRGVPLWVGGGGAEALGLDRDVVHVITTWSEVDAAIVASRKGMELSR
jgi:DNA-binding transcriptional MerR regulator/methylmalonyl-CoA mutase cobalamin-binding subunit